MKEELVEEKEENLKERNNSEGKDELKENDKEIFMNPKEQLDFQDDENNEKKINYFLYFIPEGIFNICFLIGIGSYNYILLSFFYPSNIIFYWSFFKNKYFYLNNYLLISKLISIEILIFFPIIYFVKRDESHKGNLAFIILFILGALSGLFSLIYLFIKIYIFNNGLSKIKKIYFLYFELIAIILFMHPFLLYIFYMYNNILISQFLSFKEWEAEAEAIFIFSFYLFFYALNFCLLCMVENKNKKAHYDKICMTCIKFFFYLLYEIIFLDLYTAKYLENKKYIFFSIRVILMIISLIVSFIIK